MYMFTHIPTKLWIFSIYSSTVYNSVSGYSPTNKCLKIWHILKEHYSELNVA